MHNMNLQTPDSQILDSKYDDILLQNEISRLRWSNFKEEHNTLKDRLLLFRDKLKHDIMVPVGKLALFKGQLVHTNEILVSLGDGWFAKRSVTDAIQICERRIKYCDEMLSKLTKERDLFTTRKSFPGQNELFSQDEIVEPYDEERETLWREKHKEKVKMYKKQETQERQQNICKEEKDIFELLDVLEAQEELEDEMNRLNHDDEHNEDTESECDEEDDEYEDDEDEGEEDSDNNDYETTEQITEKMGIKDTSSSRLESDQQILLGNSLSKKPSHRVSFAVGTNEESDIKPICINFKHSDVTPSSEVYPKSDDKIISPSDIYKAFIQTVSAPKSILKKTNSVQLETEQIQIDIDRHTEETSPNNSTIKSESAVVSVKIGDVMERQTEISKQATQQSVRPISKFKAARQFGKK